MQPTVTIIKDSINPEGIRLTTLHARYWRAIHADLMTHRVFSRNARSSRAAPSATFLAEEIFVPRFMKNRSGMQATEDLSRELLAEFQKEWTELAEITRGYVARWSKNGMHKQWANRPLEWFGWIDVLITSTYWDNFMALRGAGFGAQPELQDLANAMKTAMDTSLPTVLQPGEWHLPYVLGEEKTSLSNDVLLKLSTARCARLSYRPFDGEADYESEFRRYDQLIVSRPVHASPAEHQATPDSWSQGDIVHMIEGPGYNHPDKHGNFYGWVQYRKMLPHEAVMEDYDGLVR